jgi:arsenate reductase
MAEGWARHLKSDCIEPYSAGLLAKGLNARAVQVMAESGVDISRQTSQEVSEVLHIEFDYVVTVCGHADEHCPVFPGKAQVVHVGFDDPPKLAESAKSDEEALGHYRRVRDEIHAFVEKLPHALTSPATKEDSAMEKITKIYSILSPLPLVLLALISIYVKQFDGWGAWAAAPLLIPPFILSFVQGLWGILLIRQAKREDVPQRKLMSATLLAGSLAILAILKIGWMEFRSSFL